MESAFRTSSMVLGALTVAVLAVPPPVCLAVNSAPTVTINSPSDGDHTRDHYITVSGTAWDDVTVIKVQVQVNAGGWYKATGTTSWSRYMELDMGNNQIDVRAQDNIGWWSAVQTVNVYRWPGGADVCVVDDDFGAGHESYYTNALTAMGASYSVWEVNSQGAMPAEGLAQFTGPGKCVVWFTGSDRCSTLTSTDQTNLGTFLDAGGRLFLSGQDIGYDIHMAAFYSSYLKASYVQDNVGLWTIAGDANEPMTSYWSGGTTFAISGGTGASNQGYPDEIDPLTYATTILTYQATTASPPVLPLAMGPPVPGKSTGMGARGISSSGTAGQKVKTSLYKLVYFAFGYEAIAGVNSRNRMMENVCDWLMNAWPTQPTVSISPTNPSTNDDLHCSASGSTDPDGDPVTYKYQWWKNCSAPPNRVWPTLSSSRTSPGDVWYCQVTPNDGTEDGPCAYTPTVWINTPPTAPTVNITPSSPADGDDLTCSAVGSTDWDGDPVTYQYQWYKNGVVCPARVWPTVDRSRTSPGDTWRCVVTPTDGIDDGPTSEDSVIIYGAPSMPTVTIMPSSPYTYDDLTCNASGSVDPGGQPVTYSYQWYRNGVLKPARVWPTISSSRTSPGDVWRCVVTPNNGTADGPPGQATVTVLNRPPTKPTVTITPTSPTTNDDLTCNASGSTDSDGDTVTYQYQWYKNGVICPARVWPTIDHSRTSPGDTWKCVVTPTDGMQNGPSASYSVIVQGSSAPALSALSAQPAAAGAQVVFTLSADASVSAEVMNIAGRPVRVLVADKAMAAGINTLTWNGRSASGLAVPSGVYLLRVRAANETGGQCEVLGTVMVTR